MILLIHCLAISSVAQPVYHFENLTEEHGLSDNRVTCFLKDRTGFMWIGTENGLNRFDGRSFLIYQPGKSKYAISNSSVNDIEEDSEGRLWVSTLRGLNRIDPKKDTTFVYLPGTGKRLPSDLIWDTYFDQQGRLWIAPDNRDLCYLDLKTDSFTYIPWIQFVNETIPRQRNRYKSIRKIWPKSPDELWLGTAIGLFSYRISTTEFKYYESYDADHFIQLETSPNGKTAYFTQNPVPSFRTLQLETGIIEDIPWNKVPTTSSNQQRDKDCSHYRWLPAGKNLLEINTVTGESLMISHLADDPNSLPDGMIRSSYCDNTGLVWVATNKGVGKFNPAMDPFHFENVLPAAVQGVAGENDLFRYSHAIHTIFYSQQDNKYYLGSPATNSLIIIDKATGHKKVISSIEGIPLFRCSVIFEDSRGILWILGAKNAFCYDRKTQRFTIAPFRPGKRTILSADMAEDNDGNLWIACHNEGLYRYDIKNKTTLKFDESNGFSKYLSSLYFDKATNKLLAGTFSHGLFVLDLPQLSFKRILKDHHAGDHSRFSLITDVTVDKNGTLWTSGYATGIARVHGWSDSSLTQLQMITTQDGLPENIVYALQPDLQGNIWASTFQGLTRISPTGRVMDNYNRKNGLNFTNFFSPFSITAAGEILTGIGTGFIRFQPDSLPYATPAFPVVLTGIRPKDPTETASLSWDNNEIQFDYAALSYVNPYQTRFEYQLEGLDNTWLEADRTTTVRYNNLLARAYTFKVRAIDFTGRFSSNIASYSFAVRPPWWQTWWFRLSVVALITGLVYLLFRQRIRAVKNKAAIRQQMAELKGRALRAQMNPHFIFNCLNAIQELIVREEYSAAYTYLAKFSRLLRMVLDLSEKNYITLSNEIDMCRLYLELESMRFKNSFAYSIQVDPGLDPETVFIPSLLIQPFVENAIWHGLLQKDGEKKLLVHFADQQGKVVCIIQDNGIGRKRSAEIKAHKIGSQHFSSKGMEMARQRIEVLQANGAADTSMEIIDGTDETGHATGTTVRITIASPENTAS